MPEQIILGLVGYGKAGKDEVADVLTDGGFVKIGMSDALHECLLILDPIIGLAPRLAELSGQPQLIRYAEFCNSMGYTFAKGSPEVRELLQRMGTEVGRNRLFEDIWVNEMLKKAADHPKVVVTGIRYVNEASACTHLWHISRIGHNAVNDHSSEELAHAHNPMNLPYNYRIYNDGTLAQLAIQTKIAEYNTFGG